MTPLSPPDPHTSQNKPAAPPQRLGSRNLMSETITCDYFVKTIVMMLSRVLETYKEKLDLSRVDTHQENCLPVL